MILIFHFPLGCHNIDVLNNVDDLSENDIDSLLLQKENFWIGTLMTQHKGLNVVMMGIDNREFIEICDVWKYETFYCLQSIELEFIGERLC